MPDSATSPPTYNQSPEVIVRPDQTLQPQQLGDGRFGKLPEELPYPLLEPFPLVVQTAVDAATGALRWAVASQLWEEDDLLMARIRVAQARQNY